MCQIHSYEQFLNNSELQTLSCRISPRIESFLNKFKKIFLTHVSLNRIDELYRTTISSQMNKLTYPKVEQNGPFCSRNLTQCSKQNYSDYHCFTCEETMGTKNATCICEVCFTLGNHPGHNFRLRNAALAICDCGDEQVLDKRFFCHRHKGESQFQQNLVIDSEIELLFIKEMQFLFYLFFRLKNITMGLLDQNQKKEIFASQIFQKLLSFCEKSYSNQNIFASFLRSTYKFKYPLIPESQNNKSMLNIMFKCTPSYEFLQKLCLKVLLPLYCVKKIRQIVLIQFFEYTSSKETFLSITSPISNLTFQYLGASNQIIALAQGNLLKPLVINFNFSSFQEKSLAYIRLFTNYQNIARAKKAEQTIPVLLSRINITQLCYFCIPKEEKLNRTQVLVLEIEYFKLITQLMKIIVKSSQKENLLKKLIKQTYACIKTKKQSLSFSVQRTFSFAVFAYMKCQLQNLYDWQQQQLLELLEQQYAQDFIGSVKNLIKKSLHLIKIDNFNEYKKMMINDMQLIGFSKIMPSIDHIYSRILLMFIIKFQRPSYSQIISPIQHFIDVRQKAIKSLYEMFEEDQMSKTEETLGIMFYEIFLMFNNFLFLSQSSISEIITSEYLGFPCQQETFEIYRVLVYTNPENNAKQFKKLAQKYLNNPKLIEKFIKTEFNSYRQQIESGQIPENMFNISYNSFYITPASFKEYNSLYFLKLKRSRKTELSSFLFPKQTLSNIVKLSAWFFDIYNKSFKQNEVVSSKNVVVVAIESLIVLYLQTRNEEIKSLIDSIIQTKMIGNLQMPYQKQILEMYESNQKKLKELREKDTTKYDDQGEKKRKQGLKNKIMQKKKLLKHKQSQALRNMSGSQDIFRQQHYEPVQRKNICIICKTDQSHLNLCYLAYFRYSNFMSKNLGEQNFPIMLITTCGHLIHEQCFGRVHSRRTAIFLINCSLCKAQCNTLVPAVDKPNVQQASRYLTRINLQQHIFKHEEEYINVLQAKVPELNTLNLKLIASMVYEIFGYSLYYTKYLAQKIMPILKMNLFSLAQVKIQLSASILLESHFRKSQHNFQIFELILKTILLIINSQNDYQQLYSKEMADKLRMMENNEVRMITKEKHIYIIKMFFDELMGKNFYFYQYVQALKDKKSNQEHKNVYKLPKDLEQLNREVGLCPKCLKRTSKIVICFLCSKRFCQGCRQEYNAHSQEHLGGTAYIRVERGQCFFNYKRRIPYDFLYLDYIGDQIKNESVFPEVGKYLLNNQKRNALIEDILDDKIASKVVQSLNRNARCEVQ